MRRIWLDDDPNRRVPPGYDTIVRTAPEAIRLLQTGNYDHISLDHDLGDPEDPEIGTGYDVATWLEEQAYYGTFPRISWDIHSANSVGRQRMLAAMTNADRYWTMNEQKISKASVVRIASVAPSDKRVIDAFYNHDKKEGNRLSTDGHKLVSHGLGGGDIAEWRDKHIVITTQLDSNWKQSVVRHMKRSIPANVLKTAGKKKFTNEEAQAIAAELGIDFEKGGFDIDQFRRGLDVELEHGSRIPKTDVSGDDPLVTGKIAWAHLIEFPDYYDRLDKLEEKAKEDWSEKAASTLPTRISVNGHVYQRVAVSGRELDPKQVADAIKNLIGDAKEKMSETVVQPILDAFIAYVNGNADTIAKSTDKMGTIRKLRDRSDSLYQDAFALLSDLQKFSSGTTEAVEEEEVAEEEE